MTRQRDVSAVLTESMPLLAQRYGVPGAQLAVYRHGRTDSVEFGQPQHQSPTPVTGATVFPVGSITKCFTATAAMVLVADGDLDLDEPIAAYLSGLDRRCAQITLRQLLSHTSGLGSGAVPGTVSTVSAGRYTAEHCRDSNLVLPPGSGFSYSNAGFVVAGHLIEVVTGMDFREALESTVLRPLGIEPAFVNGTHRGAAEQQLATGYSVNLTLGRTRPVEQSLAVAETPAGGLAATALDLIALARLHLDGGIPKVMAPAAARQMRAPVPQAEPFGLAQGWGLGLADYGAGWLGHDGNANGTSCYVRLHPESGMAVALTSNAGTGSEIWRELLDELDHVGIHIGQPTLWPEQPTQLASPQECVGVYHNGAVAYVVHATGSELQLAVDGGVYAPMICQEDLTFALRMPTSGQQLFCGRFLRNPVTGVIDSLQVSGRLARRGEQAAPVIVRQREMPNS
ncbi:serine hydrolase [Catellatospora sp. TT07R-123]|uniref:serine hydrolase domain-containing protein n=1 Tax=Catellatospora sp. TT07R-123 TaxID=2733863 RepID=UPI001BB36CD2|nr:serine hydrolase domain-containing protein [Catellatospora sp. TT07R-123]